MKQHFDFLRGYVTSDIQLDTSIISVSNTDLPTLTAGDYFDVVLSTDTYNEIITVTGTDPDAQTLSATRGREGTTPRLFPIGSEWANAPVASDFISVIDEANIVYSVDDIEGPFVELPEDGAPGVATKRSLGTGPNQAAPGDDARFHPQIDAKTYGATGDGTTDDTTGLQLWIAALNTSGGRGILPAGTYILNGILAITNPSVRITGDNSGSTIIVAKAAYNADLIRFNLTSAALQGAGMSGITVRGANPAAGTFFSAPLTAPSSLIGIHITDSNGLDFTDVVVEGFNGANGCGFYIQNVAGTSERIAFDKVWLNHNKNGILYAGTDSFPSFARQLGKDIRFNCIAGGKGIATKDVSGTLTAWIRDSYFNITGTVLSNFGSGNAEVFAITNGGYFQGTIEAGLKETGASTARFVHASTGGYLHAIGKSIVALAANGTQFGIVDDTAGTSTVVSGVPATGPHVVILSSQIPDDQGVTSLVPTAGSIAAFGGSANTGRINPQLVGSLTAVLNSFGMISGPSILSTYTSFYNAVGNGFIAGSVNSGQALSQFRELFRVDADGTTIPKALAYKAVTFTGSGAVTLTPLNGTYQIIVMTGNITSVTLGSGTRQGQLLTLQYTQDGTGGRTYAWPTNVVWDGIDTAPANITTAQKSQTRSFIWDSVSWRQTTSASGTSSGGLTAEEIDARIGAMFSGNLSPDITTTYNDAVTGGTGKIDLDLATLDDTNVDPTKIATRNTLGGIVTADDIDPGTGDVNELTAATHGFVNEANAAMWVARDNQYDANTVRIANTDNTPINLALTGSTVVGRTASGAIKAVTFDEITGTAAGGGFYVAAIANDGTTDDTDAWQSALDDCLAAGGGTVMFPPGGEGSVIKDAIHIPGGVGIMGANTTENVTDFYMTASRFLTQNGTDPSATPSTTYGRVCCGDGGVGTYGSAAGPKTGNFTIDGVDGGHVGGLFYSNQNLSRIFEDIHVVSAPGDSFLIERTQNCKFDSCDSINPAQDGFVFDYGCGGLLFLRTESQGAGRDHMSFKNGSGGPYTVPTHIQFLKGDIEYKNPTTNTFRNLLRATAGVEIIFDGFHFGGVNVNATDGYLIHIDSGKFTFRDSRFDGNHQSTGSKLIYVKSGELWMLGRNIMSLAPTAFYFDTSIYGRSDGHLLTQVTTEVEVVNSAVAQRFQMRTDTGAVLFGPVSGVATLQPNSYDHMELLVSANCTTATVSAGRYLGHRFTLTLYQSGGSHTWAPASNMLFASPFNMPLTNAAFISVTFWWNGTNWQELSRSSDATLTPVVRNAITVAPVNYFGTASTADYVCDGVADQVQIQAAIDAAFLLNSDPVSGSNKVTKIAGKPIVRLLPGHYTVSAPIRVKTGVSVMGQAASDVLIDVDSVNAFTAGTTSNTGGGITGLLAVFILDNIQTELVRVSGITINGQGVAGVSGFWYNSNAFVSSTLANSDSHLSIDHIVIEEIGSVGIYNNKNRSMQVNDVRITGAGSHGMWTQGPDGHAHNVQAGGCVGHGFFLDAGNWRFTNCKTWYSGGDGFYLNKTRLSLSGCEAQDNTQHGFEIGAGNNVLVGCIADSNSWNGSSESAGGGPTGLGFDGFKVSAGNSVSIIGCSAYDKNPVGDIDRGPRQQYGLNITNSSAKGMFSVVTENNRTYSHNIAGVPRLGLFVRISQSVSLSFGPAIPVPGPGADLVQDGINIVSTSTAPDPADPTQVFMMDDFMAGSASSANIGQLGWTRTALCTVGAQAAVADHPGIVQMSTNASPALTFHGLYPNGGAGAFPVYGSDFWDVTWWVKLNVSDSILGIRVGLQHDPSNASVVSASGAYFEKLGSDSNWFYVVRNNSIQAPRVDSGITTAIVGGQTWVKLRVRRYSSTVIKFTINSGTEVDVTTTSPNSPTEAQQPSIQLYSTTTTSRTIDIDRFQISITGLAR